MRGKKAKVRELKPDYKYKSIVITKLINYIMLDGKKDVAQQAVYTALDIAGKESKMKPFEVFEKALDNVKPRVEVRSRRVGGANYQVPTPVDERRQLSLALRWIVDASRANRGGATFAEALARELVASANKEGNAYKKREDVQKMAEANRAFAHFSW